MILAFCLIRKYNSSLSVWCNFFKGVAWLFGIINQRTTELPIIIRVDSLRQWDSALVSFQNQECLALVLQNHHQYWQSKFIYLLHSKSLSNNPKILNNLLNFPVHLSMYKSYVHYTFFPVLTKGEYPDKNLFIMPLSTLSWWPFQNAPCWSVSFE